MKTVLLVEDEPALRDLVTELLEASGYEVIAAATGGLALEAAERHAGRLDVLLTDLLLPGLSGAELAKRLQKARPDLRVVYMSGYTEDSLPENDAPGPRALLISKPFTQETLVRTLLEALSSPPRDDR
jgi:CheY-like chemotaxis protein